MVFCPLGDSTGDSPLSDAALLDLGRREGELLASEFERIRKDTDSRQVGDWRNEPLAEALVDAALTKTMNRLARSGRWGKENQSASAAFWEPVEPFMRHGWLQLRARTKPLGYAGDYELLEAICENRVADGPAGTYLRPLFPRTGGAGGRGGADRTKHDRPGHPSLVPAERTLPLRRLPTRPGPRYPPCMLPARARSA